MESNYLDWFLSMPKIYMQHFAFWFPMNINIKLNSTVVQSWRWFDLVFSIWYLVFGLIHEWVVGLFHHIHVDHRLWWVHSLTDTIFLQQEKPRSPYLQHPSKDDRRQTIRRRSRHHHHQKRTVSSLSPRLYSVLANTNNEINVLATRRLTICAKVSVQIQCESSMLYSGLEL